MMEYQDIFYIILTGLSAGLLGGLLGLGGSVIMIPVLVFMGRGYPVAQAAAMCVNVVVAFTSALKHHKKKAIPWEALRWAAPSALIGITVGVFGSTIVPGRILTMIFGAFLLALSGLMTWHVIKHGKADESLLNPKPRRSLPVGLIMGLQAGLLGVGGGVIIVPLLRKWAHFPSRQAVACSAAVMCTSAPIGAVLKVLTLPHCTPAAKPAEALIIAAFLAPTAMLGSWLGASLTHKIKVIWIQLALLVLMLLAGGKLLLSP